MAITEEARHNIYEAFKASFGDQVANGLMEMLPPVGWADVATKHDLAALEERLELRFDAVDARFDAVDARFEIVEARMGERLESSLKDLQREMRDQANRFMGVVIAAAGLSLAAGTAIARFI